MRLGPRAFSAGMLDSLGEGFVWQCFGATDVLAPARVGRHIRPPASCYV